MLSGEVSIEVDAPAQACFDLVAELDRYPEWQTQVREATVLERDGDGRALVVETVSDAKVRTLRYRLRYAYDPPHGMSWTYVDGDIKDLNGAYRFEPLEGGRTRVSFRLEVDPGRRLGLLLRGPIAEEVRK
jgi:ribosome-associated toxin RatA of RatAB toxin-antitoxin module